MNPRPYACDQLGDEQPLHTLFITRRGDGAGTTEVTLPLGRLLRQDVALIGLVAPNLAAPRNGKPLLRAFVCLHLRHANLSLGGQNHRHGFSLELRICFDLAHVDKLLRDANHDLSSQFRVRNLTPTEHQGDLDLVPIIQKLARVPDLRLEVMFLDARSEFDFLELDHMLLFLGLASHLGLLELVLPEVHDADDRRASKWRYFNEVEAELLCSAQRRINIHNSKLGAVVAYDTERRETDLTINARTFDVWGDEQHLDKEKTKKRGPPTQESAPNPPWRSRCE